MRVIVTLTIDRVKEIVIEGDAQIFDTRLKPWLGDIGIWLEKWQYCDSSGKGAYHKSRVFIPWGSVLYLETEEE